MNTGVSLYKNQGEITDEIPKNLKVGLHCICAVHQLGRKSKKSAQQVSRIKHSLRQFANAQAFIHRGFAQLCKRSIFGQTLALH